MAMPRCFRWWQIRIARTTWRVAVWLKGPGEHNSRKSGGSRAAGEPVPVRRSMRPPRPPLPPPPLDCWGDLAGCQPLRSLLPILSTNTTAITSAVVTAGVFRIEKHLLPTLTLTTQSGTKSGPRTNRRLKAARARRVVYWLRELWVREGSRPRWKAPREPPKATVRIVTRFRRRHEPSSAPARFPREARDVRGKESGIWRTTPLPHSDPR